MNKLTSLLATVALVTQFATAAPKKPNGPNAAPDPQNREAVSGATSEDDRDFGTPCKTSVYYKDTDNDGFLAYPYVRRTECVKPTGYKLFDEGKGQDCDDNDATITIQLRWYLDFDNDGFRNCCQEAFSCTKPSGNYKLFSELKSFTEDCNDNNAQIVPLEYYKDDDKDGYSDGKITFQCERPDGEGGFYVLKSELKGMAIDCNDADANVNPGATEVCNGIDDDCDGSVDEGVTSTTWYKDADGDGFTDGTTTMACVRPVGYKMQSELRKCGGERTLVAPAPCTDCNDSDPNVNPNVKWYQDADNDGYASSRTLTQCTRPTGYKLKSELQLDGEGSLEFDCDDRNKDVNKPSLWYLDADNDGYPDLTAGVTASCNRPFSMTKLASELKGLAGDCNDANAAINPGATEICGNRIDDNCNGQVDENCVVNNACQGIVVNVPRAVIIYETPGGVTNGEITVALNRACNQPVSVNWAFANGTFINHIAIVDQDFRAGSGTLTFAPGETSKIITLEVLHDRLVEDFEYVNILLTNPVNARAEDGRALIGSLDTYPCRAEAVPTYTEGNNGNTKVTYTMKLNKPYPEAVSVAYRTADNAAKAGTDYVAQSGIVTFAPEQTEATIELEIIGDRVRETPKLEGFFLILTRPNKLACNGPEAYVAVFINDDDDNTAPSLMTFNTWPNPVQSQLNVQLSSSLSERVSLQLVNADGKIVKQIEATTHGKHRNNYTIGVAELPKGLYKLVLKGKSFVEAKSVIIQR
ncbi:MAG: T9SS C-terminal target domain-containing protein [Bacteroidetes bacterium]|nr:MAG: T9SS C-terminal target domain-containing protein [Bacteroidota bacterium]